MVSKTVVVNNPLGIHARPAALIVQRASRFGAEIFLSNVDAQRINGKSIMGVMMLAAENGVRLELEAEGPDGEGQLRALAELVDSGFGEE